MTTLRVGVIGGGFGRNHVLGFQTCEQVEVVALCQRTRDRAAALARDLGVPDIHTDWQELVARNDIDIVSIAAPPYIHHAATTAAFASGKHVLCEKPMAMHLQEARDMLGQAQSSGRCHMLSFNWRFIPAMQRMKELIDEGYLGRVYHVNAQWLGEGRADPQQPAYGWRHQKALALVGAMGDVGVHVIDMLRWLFGDFQRVVAHSAIFNRERPKADGSGMGQVEVDDACAILAELPQGIQAIMHCSGVARKRNVVQVAASGMEGTLIYELERTQPNWITGRLYGARKSDATISLLPLPERLTAALNTSDMALAVGTFNYANIARRMVEGIRTGRKPIPDFSDGVKSQEVLDAILQSATEERWVHLPLP